MSIAPGTIPAHLAALVLIAGAAGPAMGNPNAAVAPSADEQARTIADLQRQIDELKAMVQDLQAAQLATAPPVAPSAPTQVALTSETAAASSPPQVTPVPPTPAAPQLASQSGADAPTTAARKGKPWYEKLRLRG